MNFRTCFDCSQSISKYIIFLLSVARWTGSKDGHHWSKSKTHHWLCVSSIGCMSEPNRARMGTTITIDTYNADYADSSDAVALAEMFLVLQLGTCGQFSNRGTAVLITFPNLLLR